MPVALSRFIRALSGGKWVTDELVAVRSGKVEAALEKAQAELDKLTFDRLQSQRLTDKLAALEQRRVDALALDSNGDKCEALEPIKEEARAIFAEVTETVAAVKLVGAGRDARVDEIDIAIGAAQAAIDKVTAPGPQGDLQNALTPLEAKRGLLNDAAEVADIERETTNADGIELDLKTVEDDAIAAQVVVAEWERQKLLVDAALGTAQTAVNLVTAVSIKGPLDIRYNTLSGQRDTLANATTLDDMGTESGTAGTLVGDFGTLENDAKAAQLVVAERDRQKLLVDTALGTAQTAINLVTVVGVKGPLELLYTPLSLRRDTLANAATLGEMGTESGTAGALIVEIGTLEADAKAAEVTVQQRVTQKGLADTALGKADTAIKSIDIAAIRSPLDPKYSNLTGKRDLLANAATLDNIKAELLNAPQLLVDAGQLETDAKGEKVVADGIKAKNTRTDQFIAATQSWIDLISDVTAKGLLNNRFTVVQQKRLAIDSIAVKATLLSEVGTVQSEAISIYNDAKDTNTDQENTKNKDALNTGITDIDDWIKGVTDPTGKSALEGKSTALKLKRDNANTITDRTMLESELAKLDKERDALLWEAAADKEIQNAGAWLKVLDTGTVKGLLETSLQQTKQKRLLANAETDPTARQAKFATVFNEAVANRTDAAVIHPSKGKLEKRCHQVEVLLKTIPATDPGRAQLVLDLTALSGEVVSDLAAATSVNGYKLKVTELNGKADTLSGKIRDAQAALVDVNAKKLEVTKTLDEIVAALADITDTSVKDPLALESTGLANRKNPAFIRTPVLEQKKDLTALAKEGLALLEKVHIAAMKAKCGTESGRNDLDAKIKLLSGQTNNPQAEAMCKAALQARFALTFSVPEGMATKKLPNLYEMFLKVPAKHVGHDKLKKLRFGTEPGKKGNYYNSGKAKIAFNDMAESDATYTMENDEGDEIEANYYNATTLHEIGHSVDALHDLMKMKTAGFGNWEKSSPDAAAQAHCDGGFVARFSGGAKKPTPADLKTLLLRILDTGSCAKPASATAPLGSLFDDWDAINADDTVKICAVIRDPDQSPWNSGTASKAQAGARVHHAAYPNDWYSYEYGERTSGVSQYQWRAPGEWFAEIYAMHYLDKKPAPGPVLALFNQAAT